MGCVKTRGTEAAKLTAMASIIILQCELTCCFKVFPACQFPRNLLESWPTTSNSPLITISAHRFNHVVEEPEKTTSYQRAFISPSSVTLHTGNCSFPFSSTKAHVIGELSKSRFLKGQARSHHITTCSGSVCLGKFKTIDPEKEIATGSLLQKRIGMVNTGRVMSDQVESHSCQEYWGNAIAPM